MESIFAPAQHGMSLLGTQNGTSNSGGANALASALATGSTSASSSSSTSTSTSSSDITANDFLTLLVTELQNQDPTQPQDPNEYIDQLVNVNSLQQLISINSGIGTLDTDVSGTGSTSTTGSGQTATAHAQSATPATDAAPATQSVFGNGSTQKTAAQ